jgi:plasmid replication initiation protein
MYEDFEILDTPQQKNEMILSKKHNIVMANKIIKGKQSKMSLQLLRLIRIAISQISKYDTELLMYETTVKELADFLNISPKNLYRDIEDIATEGLQSIIHLEDDEYIHRFQWFNLFEYEKKTGTLRLQLHPRLKPYLLGLDSFFTMYKLDKIVLFDSYYAIRLYELILCDDNATKQDLVKLNYKIDYLRKYFNCEDKYSRIIDFKKNVIDIAIKEINEKSDKGIKVNYNKKGRSIHSVDFYIQSNWAYHETKRIENQLNEVLNNE